MVVNITGDEGAMMNRRNLVLIIIAFLVVFVICGCGAGKKHADQTKQNEQAGKSEPVVDAGPAKGTPENPIVMGFNPAESADVVLVNADALMAELEKKTGFKYKSYVAQSYNALVTSLKFESCDFAWLPAFAFVEAEQHADAKILLKAVRNGAPYYYSAIVVRSDSPYKKIEDLKGKSMAWVSETSASGYLFPMAAMMKMGLNPETFFAHQVMAGGHDTVLMAVEKGTVDAGATFAGDNQGKQGSWTQYLKGKDIGKIRPIFFTDPIPADTMSTSEKFNQKYPDVVQQVTKAVKELSLSEEGKSLLKKLYNIDAMVDAKSEDYEPVREAARLLGIDIEGKRKKAEEPKTTNQK